MASIEEVSKKCQQDLAQAARVEASAPSAAMPESAEISDDEMMACASHSTNAKDLERARWKSYAKHMVQKLHFTHVGGNCTKTEIVEALKPFDLFGSGVLVVVFDEKTDGECDNRPRQRLPPHCSGGCVARSQQCLNLLEEVDACLRM